MIGESVELAAALIGVNKWLSRVVGGRDSKVVNIDGGENVGDGVEALEKDGKEGVDGKDTHVKKGVGVELFAAYFVKFEESGVGSVEFVGGRGDLDGSRWS